MKIWIDGDACPREIKEIIFKASIRTQIELVYVANSYHKVPKHRLFTTIVVDKTPDAADHYLTEKIQADDILITSDIPLAYEAIQKKANIINPRGFAYTEDNIRDKLATRDLLDELRGSGLVSGGPKPLNSKNKKDFAAILDRLLGHHKSLTKNSSKLDDKN